MAEITSDIERYTRLLERDPDSRVFAPLAEACRKANRLQEALDIARAGVERHPTYASGRVALARAQLSLEQYEDAAEELEQAIAHAPENALAYRLLGEVRRSLGQHGAAFEAFARALALNPEDGEARDAVAILEQEAVSAVAPEHPPPVFEETPESAAPEPEFLEPEAVEAEPPAPDVLDSVPLEEADAPDFTAPEPERLEPEGAETAPVEDVPLEAAPVEGASPEAVPVEPAPSPAEEIWPLAPDTPADPAGDVVPAPFEEPLSPSDEITLTDEITGHEYDEEPPAPMPPEAAGEGATAELDLALEPVGEADAAPADPVAPDFGPAFGPDALSAPGADKHESVTPSDFAQPGGDEEAAFPVDAGDPTHPDEAVTAGDVPLERFLDDLDIGQSSLAPEARESAPVASSVEELPAVPPAWADTEAIPAPEKEEPPDGGPSAGSAIPLDGRVEELADQYRAQGHVHRARALYRALLEGNEMNLGARRKLEELGEDTEPPVQVPPPHDRMVRAKVEENIDSLNRWLANIKRGAAR